MEPFPTRDRRVSGKKLISMSHYAGDSFERLTRLGVPRRHHPQ